MNTLDFYHLPLTIDSPQRTVNMNAFLIYDVISKEAMMIDPGAEAEKIFALLREFGLNLKYICLTHGHFDHIMAVSELADKTAAKICMSQKEEFFIRDSEWNAVYMLGLDKVEPFTVDMYIQEGCVLSLGSQGVLVLETPGHTPGSVSFYYYGHLFSGDVVLRGGTGRMDLLGVDNMVIAKTIREKILRLPGETVIHCGHREMSSVAYEREHNSALDAS